MRTYFCLGVLALLSVSVQSGAEDFVVVVSVKSNVDKLSATQVQQIFTGKSEYFPNGNPALPIDQVEASPMREIFDTKVLEKSVAQTKAYWAKVAFTGKGHAPRELSSSAEVKAIVGANPSTIGYIDKGSLDGSVKVVYGE